MLLLPQEGPLFIKTSMAERLTVVGVDAGVAAVNGGSFDVIFVGTTAGRILKLVYPRDGRGQRETVLVESIQVRCRLIHGWFGAKRFFTRTRTNRGSFQAKEQISISRRYFPST